MCSSLHRRTRPPPQYTLIHTVEHTSGADDVRMGCSEVGARSTIEMRSSAAVVMAVTIVVVMMESSPPSSCRTSQDGIFSSSNLTESISSPFPFFLPPPKPTLGFRVLWSHRLPWECNPTRPQASHCVGWLGPHSWDFHGRKPRGRLQNFLASCSLPMQVSLEVDT